MVIFFSISPFVNVMGTHGEPESKDILAPLSILLFARLIDRQFPPPLPLKLVSSLAFLFFFFFLFLSNLSRSYKETVARTRDRRSKKSYLNNWFSLLAGFFDIGGSDTRVVVPVVSSP